MSKIVKNLRTHSNNLNISPVVMNSQNSSNDSSANRLKSIILTEINSDL